ncbi:putative hybrid NRPS/PKS enzyme [Colletotrichum cereale]|nr:putative hybrid NRPS/PKS enzyme [Colletotrichum cereale]
MAYTQPPKEPIAIIGRGCRFPGENSTNPSGLWDLLLAPRDLAKRIPSESRFNPDGFYHPNGEYHGSINVKDSYFIEEDPRLFDAGFFSIAPREAEAIDPQQRLLLETTYEAMENAGLTLQGLKGSRTSVYVGIMSADYTETQLRDPESVSQYWVTGSSRALTSNRLSYFFDWRGPSMTIDTACSSSMVAFHLAVQSLRNGECQISCVAGANLMLAPDSYIGASNMHLLSPEGKSKMWDDSADGYARGEGICVMLLKPLSQALRDGNRIDALIRETGINSDGRTQGITMPSASAQASLIRKTYENAGLDLGRAEDRPQYVEAHGTGTQAGDPQEASAISQTFFPPNAEHDELFVGSVKTIIGHTEGCAGMAGLLKTSLAMQHKTIPPNLHFRKLNPSVAPWYKKLRICTTPHEWPRTAPGHPLRASVNGFGSGGTNVHIIVETYLPEVHDIGPWGRPERLLNSPSSAPEDTHFVPIPLVFSANSETALVAMLERYANLLANTDVPMQRLAATLSAHRSVLAVRIAVPGTSRQVALEAIIKHLSVFRETSGTSIGTRSVMEFGQHRRTQILGVFTGQGAQWPEMGKSLIRHCSLFKETIEALEQSLRLLPDPPDWSLKAELMASPQESRLSEAALAQPLSAAIQLALVRLLYHAGVSFHTVIGHSSGETVAAYAAGKISLSDAIRIAYYRGVHSKLAGGLHGQKGAMIAVGFGIDEANDFCSSATLKGRLVVAASNSPKSVTLSGDKDAVNEAKRSLDEKGLFNRLLRVDNAYHSHHMEPCSNSYVDSLANCNIQILPGNGTTWISTVHEDKPQFSSENDTELRATYWRDNMVQKVLFSQAVEYALDHVEKPFDLVLEIGPHPSLRGPVLDTLRAKIGTDIPYSGVLDRKADDVLSLSSALGFIWTTLGSTAVDFSRYCSAYNLERTHTDVPPLPDLPTYPWDHQTLFWRESRINRQFRSRADAPHELLGKRTPDDTDYEPRWRNFFNLNEMPWLRGHCIQNEIIVPAATYCVMALEAARAISKGKHVESIELLDLKIRRPIIVDEASGGTETLFSLRSDPDSNKINNGLIQASFNLSAASSENGQMGLVATGEIRISIGSGPSDLSSSFSPTKQRKIQSGLMPINIDRFYESLSKVGLNYSGVFKGLIHAERRMDVASAVVAVDEEIGCSMPVHPTWLDVCFQTVFAAFSAPRDESLWTAWVPTRIGRLIFTPTEGRVSEAPALMNVDTHITEFTPGFQAAMPRITGDVRIHDAHTQRLAVHIEDLTLSSVLPSTEKNDRHVFLKTIWKRDVLSGPALEPLSTVASRDEVELIDACEAAVCHYLLKLKTGRFWQRISEKNRVLSVLAEQAAIRSKTGPPQPDLASILERFGERIDMRLIRAIGENHLRDAQSSTERKSPPPDLMGELMSQWHKEGLGFAQIHRHIVSAAKQISHRFPHLRILQVGPSSTSLVRSLCEELGHAFTSYTIVAGSDHTVEEMKEELVPRHSRVNFNVLDIEKGFEEAKSIVAAGSVDLVIVHQSLSKHKTAIETIRTMLQPGGFLLMMAATGDHLRFPFFLSSVPIPDNQETGPAQSSLNQGQLHIILQQADFSGVDSIAFDSVPEKHSFSLVVSQAVNDQFRFLRDPLAFPMLAPPLREKLLVLGGLSSDVAKLIKGVIAKLYPLWQGEIVTVKSLIELGSYVVINDTINLLSLTELDRPLLQGLNAADLRTLQHLLAKSKNILWVTHGATSGNPYQCGTVGLGRVFATENPQKSLQFFDMDKLQGSEPIIAQSLLRLVAGTTNGDNPSKVSRLWTVEPELALANGHILIPRVIPDSERNLRLNSLRRKIESETRVRKQPVTLIRSRGSDGEVTYSAVHPHHQSSNLAEPFAVKDRIALTVEYCSADPIIPNYRDKGLFCCIGHAQNGDRFVALADSTSSVITVPRAWAIRLGDEDLQDSLPIPLLICVMEEIRSRVIENAMPSGHSTLLYEFDAGLIAAMKRLETFSTKDFHIICSNAQSSCNSLPRNHIMFSLHASRRELESRIPTTARLLIHVGQPQDVDQLSRICQALPMNTMVATFDDLDTDDLVPNELLSEALGYVKSITLSSLTEIGTTKVIEASRIVKEGIGRHTGPVVIDWTGDPIIRLTQRPLDPRNLFSPRKTYILIGLSGQIGESMCRWMVVNGARNIVVTSRNPDKKAFWKEELKELGANIVIETVDVTVKTQLARLRTRILDTMPPIGGVANGAMVLSDGLFADMTFESLKKAMRPKIDGSRNMDEVFSGDDLDFFIMFSSISAITGNPSQCNYNAANNFMVGLASQRRARNLAASVIDIGMLIGIGIMRRTEGDSGESALEKSLRQEHYMAMSERDLHLLLTEAICVGKRDEDREIATGLETFSAVSGSSPFWHSNPRFSHLTVKAGASKAPSTGGQKSLSDKLSGASTPNEALKIMEYSLLAYLSSSLKMRVENIFTEVPLIDLGIDSLVAVEIRNWVFSETRCDIPVLKILGGSSVKQICSDVVSSRPSEQNAAGVSKAEKPTTSLQKSRGWNELSLEADSSSDYSRPIPSVSPPSSIPTETGSDSGQLNLSPPASPPTGLSKGKSFRPIPLRTELLSAGQTRLYLSNQYSDDTRNLNCTASYKLQGSLDIAKMKAVLQALTHQHESFRTFFFTDEHDERPLQGILKKSRFQLREVPGISDSLDVKREFEQIQEYHYNLEEGDTFVATLLAHSDDSYTIIFGYHHIIMDGVSWQVFLQDLGRFYNDPGPLSSSKYLPAPYISFVRKQKQDKANGAYIERLGFFKDQLREPVEPLPLFPFAKVSTRKALTHYGTRNNVMYIDAKVVSAIRKISQALRTTSFHFFCSAFQVLLHRLLGVEKMCVGMVAANRSDQTFSNTIGFFLEMLPILFRVDSQQTFEDLIRTTRNQAYAALARAGLPFEEILKACDIPASTTETSLFQVVFNYRMGAGRTPSMRGVNMKFLEYTDAKTPFDLVVSVDELDSGAAMVTFSLQEYLYDQQGADLLARVYSHLLEELSKDASGRIGSVSVFDEALTREAIDLGTGPRKELAPTDAETLSKIVNSWAKRIPESVAVKDMEGSTLSYSQLMNRASSVSIALSNAGIEASSPVCVLLDPNVDTIACILGILRIGAAYVPLDLRSPDERLLDILEESGASIVLFHPATAKRAKALHGSSEATQRIRYVSLEELPRNSTQDVPDVSTLEGLAMMLYTSGSTGKPKGIPLTNANIRTPILGASEKMSLSREVVLQQSGQGFDAAVFQIFIALANGGTLIMADNRIDPAELAALMSRESVTCSVFIVSEMQAMLRFGYEELRQCSSWRLAVVAGEAFTVNLLDQFRALKRPDLTIINAYGPTEASICSSIWQVSYTDVETGSFSVPIGKPIANYATYVVDEGGNPVPVGWPGEIAISGPGVASGYANLPLLTERKFKHPTFLKGDSGRDRLYLTGDRGRMISDGSIVLLGRVDGDDQVKLRGMRVQLSDVARAIIEASQGKLADAAVLLRGSEQESQQLIAYAVFSRNPQVHDKGAFLRQLSLELPVPPYMRPATIIPIDVLPVTERGKLDRRKLADMPLPRVPLEEEASDQLTEQETRLRDIWRVVLGETASSIPIQRSSDFFSVGGNSLLLLRLRAEIRQAFAVEFSLPDLFQNSTIALLAARVAGNSRLANIDWEKETEPDERFFVSPSTRKRTNSTAQRSKGISVLLTGATGFLGAALLRQLVELHHVARVHCAAVRPNSQAEARPLGVQSSKIVRHAGDLALPNLGMSQAEADDVFEEVDVIIHNGAEVSHMKSYRSLRAANVFSTMEIARLASDRMIPIHYISTGGVARLSGADMQPESSLASFHPPVDGSDGYIASKWASEVFLERVGKRMPWSIWIHRPSSITGGDVPALDIMHNLVKYSQIIKAVPDLSGSTGAFDFVHIDKVSKDIAIRAASVIDGDKNSFENSVSYIHQSGDEVVPVDRFKDYLEGSEPGSYKALPLREWVDAAMQHGLEEVVGSFLLATKGVIRAPLLQRGRRLYF